MAEREGFEPSKQFPVYTLSKRAPSATRPPLLERYPQLLLLDNNKKPQHMDGVFQ